MARDPVGRPPFAKQEHQNMDTSEISSRYAFAQRLIREAGDFAHGYFRRRHSLTIKSKGLQDWASEADLNTEMLIKNRLAAAYSQDAFLGEETGKTALARGQGLWVVDPIDGTQPFISGLSSWCVSIAFVLEEAVKFGLVYAPARDELFAGGEGFPATLNGAPIAGRDATAISDGICGVGYARRTPPEVYLALLRRFLDAGGMFYRDGSGALGLCYAACGRLIGFIEVHLNSWDCLGALGVIQAAGLKTNDFFVNDGLHVGNPLIVGNPAIYAALEKVYGAPLPAPSR